MFQKSWTALSIVLVVFVLLLFMFFYSYSSHSNVANPFPCSNMKDMIHASHLKNQQYYVIKCLFICCMKYIPDIKLVTYHYGMSLMVSLVYFIFEYDCHI